MSEGTFIGPLTENIINRFIDEMKKNKEKIMQNLIDPVLTDIEKRYYPYIMILFTCIILAILLLILLLITNIYTINNTNNMTNTIIAKINECCSINKINR